jgi:hypothetical protein
MRGHPGSYSPGDPPDLSWLDWESYFTKSDFTNVFGPDFFTTDSEIRRIGQEIIGYSRNDQGIDKHLSLNVQHPFFDLGMGLHEGMSFFETGIV